MLDYENNVRAILQCCFSQSKDEIIESAVRAIVALKCEPVINPMPNPIDPGFYRPFPPITTSPAIVPLTSTPTITCEMTAEDLKKDKN